MGEEVVVVRGEGEDVVVEIAEGGGVLMDGDPTMTLVASSAGLRWRASEDPRPGGWSRTWPDAPLVLVLLCVVADDPPPPCALYRREPMLGDEEPDPAGCDVVESSSRTSTLLAGTTIDCNDKASCCWYAEVDVDVECDEMLCSVCRRSGCRAGRCVAWVPMKPFGGIDPGSVSSATTGEMGTSFVSDGSCTCLSILSVIRRLFRFLNHPTGDLDLDSLSGSVGGGTR